MKYYSFFKLFILSTQWRGFVIREWRKHYVLVKIKMYNRIFLFELLTFISKKSTITNQRNRKVVCCHSLVAVSGCILYLIHFLHCKHNC